MLPRIGSFITLSLENFNFLSSNFIHSRLLNLIAFQFNVSVPVFGSCDEIILLPTNYLRTIVVYLIQKPNLINFIN